MQCCIGTGKPGGAATAYSWSRLAAIAGDMGGTDLCAMNTDLTCNLSEHKKSSNRRHPSDIAKLSDTSANG
jgi:hypothetical protein